MFRNLKPIAQLSFVLSCLFSAYMLALSISDNGDYSRPINAMTVLQFGFFAVLGFPFIFAGLALLWGGISVVVRQFRHKERSATIRKLY